MGWYGGTFLVSGTLYNGMPWWCRIFRQALDNCRFTAMPIVVKLAGMMEIMVRIVTFWS